jgi:hypothetical protein
MGRSRVHVREEPHQAHGEEPPPKGREGGAVSRRNRVRPVGKETCSGEHACELG